MKTIVKLPQIGANEDTAILIEWLVAPGAQVKAGQALCTVETTKSVVDIEAETAGYIHPLTAESEEISVGAPIAVISSQPLSWEEIEAWVQNQTAVAEPAPSTAPARTWTKKAELLARRHNIDIETLLAMHPGPQLGAADAQRLIAQLQAAPQPAAGPAHLDDLVDGPCPDNRIERIIILGGGDGAVQTLDAIAHAPGQRAVAIFDDNKALWGKSMMGVPIIGGMDKIEEWRQAGRFDAAIIAISSNLAVRAQLFQQWSDRGVLFTNVIAPHVTIHANVSMGRGNLIMSNARLGACTSIGNNNFLSAYVNLEHHNLLGSHCTFGPMVSTSGRVSIGDRVSFGAGVFIEPHITIGDDSIIASGSIIRAPIPSHVIVKTHIQQSIRPR